MAVTSSFEWNCRMYVAILEGLGSSYDKNSLLKCSITRLVYFGLFIKTRYHRNLQKELERHSRGAQNRLPQSQATLINKVFVIRHYSCRTIKSLPARPIPSLPAGASAYTFCFRENVPPTPDYRKRKFPLQQTANSVSTRTSAVNISRYCKLEWPRVPNQFPAVLCLRCPQDQTAVLPYQTVQKHKHQPSLPIPQKERKRG